MTYTEGRTLSVPVLGTIVCTVIIYTPLSATVNVVPLKDPVDGVAYELKANDTSATDAPPVGKVCPVLVALNATFAPPEPDEAAGVLQVPSPLKNVVVPAVPEYVLILFTGMLAATIFVLSITLLAIVVAPEVAIVTSPDIVTGACGAKGVVPVR